MFEGLWIVQYVGMEGRDGGVVVLTKGHVLGGDNAFTYIGTYQENEQGLIANVLVQNYNPSIGNVLGVKGDFNLSLIVTSTESGLLTGRGDCPQAPGFGLRVQLTRRAKLT